MTAREAVTPNIPPTPFLLPAFTATLNTPALLPQAFIADCDVVCCGMTLGSAGASCLSCVPSQIIAHPQPTCWWGSMRSRKGLDFV